MDVREMTRDEHRAKCGEAIASVVYGKKWNELDDATQREVWLNLGLKILDSLNGIVTVLTFETLEIMAETISYEDLMSVAAAGDLTNEPEKK
jgi:hypothetical protein